VDETEGNCSGGMGVDRCGPALAAQKKRRAIALMMIVCGSAVVVALPISL
jgi:hypothetical protein